MSSCTCWRQPTGSKVCGAKSGIAHPRSMPVSGRGGEEIQRLLPGDVLHLWRGRVACTDEKPEAVVDLHEVKRFFPRKLPGRCLGPVCYRDLSERFERFPHARLFLAGQLKEHRRGEPMKGKVGDFHCLLSEL